VTRRRLAVAAIAAIAAAGTLGASAATADTVRAVDDDYIACAGLRVVPVATCVEEPVGPVLDLLPTR